MSKRIISIVLVVFMALSLFAFVGCGLSYKSAAIKEVREYAESKGESNYLADNWVFIEDLIKMAKTQIKKQPSKEDIDELMPKIKASIDLVPQDVALEEKGPCDLKREWEDYDEYYDEYYEKYLEEFHDCHEDAKILIILDISFKGREFTIDDFWMLDNIRDVKYLPSIAMSMPSRSNYEIYIESNDKKSVAKTGEILEKLCFSYSIHYGTFVYPL